MMISTRLALLALATALLMGCGGGRFGAPLGRGTGQATLTVEWPDLDDGRLLPKASRSIVVVFERNETAVSTTIIPRPASGNSTVTQVKELPIGDLVLTAQAFPRSDGTGVAQASGKTPVKIELDKDTPVTLVLDSTIVNLVVSSVSDSFTVYVEKTLQLYATGRNKDDEVVIPSASMVDWKSSDMSIASIDNTGMVTGVKVGSVTMTATDRESGKSGTATIKVTKFKTYTISGASGGTGQFFVDDNLDVYVNDERVYSTMFDFAAMQDPFTFMAYPGDTIRDVVRDTFGNCSSLSELWITDDEGHTQKIDPGFDEGCGHPGGNQGTKYDFSYTIPF
jgi:hypothetical protein